MKLPRFSIGGLMALVLGTAFGCAVIKELLDWPDNTLLPVVLILIGVFPMATILLMGFVVLIVRRASPGKNWTTLLGFEILGTLACLIFFFIALSADYQVRRGLGDLVGWLGLKPGLPMVVVAVGLILLPQIAVGALGGWLARMYQAHEDQSSGSLGVTRHASNDSFRATLLESAQIDARSERSGRR